MHTTFLPEIPRGIISRRMRWARHVASTGVQGCIQHFSWRSRRRETTWKEFGIDENIILKIINSWNN
jgi:hypothetical protein